MANPLTGVTQLGIDEFYRLLNQLSSLGHKVRDDLSADRLKLMSLYNTARNESDKVAGAAAMKALDPAIHNNSTLRLRYQDLATQFNNAVNGASALLKKAGFTAPTLSGIGAAPIVIIGVAVIALATAFTIYEALRVATDSQRKRTAALAAALSDPNTSPEERKAALDALTKGSGMNLFGDITPILGIVAVIILGPPILKMIQSRRSAA